MEIYGKPKKSLGQNFLIDKNIINKIVEIGNINRNKIVVEIGSGYGNLTDAIIKKNPKKIYAIEKDKQLSTLLINKYKNFKKVQIINKDVLEVLQENDFGKDIIVFGNLPYNVSTKILASLILSDEWPSWYGNLILMFQKEVAERILAKSKNKDFSRLTVLANWRLEIKKHFDISNNCFFPKPKIESTVLSFVPKKTGYYSLKKPKNLEKITRILFSNRRKMINKNLIKLFKNDHEIIKKLNIDLDQRPSDLSNETFYKIAAEYEKLFG